MWQLYIVGAQHWSLSPNDPDKITQGIASREIHFCRRQHIHFVRHKTSMHEHICSTHWSLSPNVPLFVMVMSGTYSDIHTQAHKVIESLGCLANLHSNCNSRLTSNIRSSVHTILRQTQMHNFSIRWSLSPNQSFTGFVVYMFA